MDAKEELLDAKEVDAEWVKLLQEAPLTPEACLDWAEKLNPFIRFLFISVLFIYIIFIPKNIFGY
jgi:hypothetical protein